MRQRRALLIFLPLLSISLVTSFFPVAAAEPGFSADLLARFAINHADRYPARAYRRLVENGRLDFENGFYSGDEPAGPIEMNCGDVDRFGVTFQFVGLEEDRLPHSPVILTITHSVFDSQGWSFLQRLAPPNRSMRQPIIHTVGFDLEDRYRHDGVFTVQAAYRDTVLLRSEFSLTGCDVEP